MKNKIDEEEEKYFNDLLHSGCSLEELVAGVFDSPKKQMFQKFLDAILEEERKINQAGFKLKIAIVWIDNGDNIDKKDLKHL